MSHVLDIDTLLESPLADLHALAGELELDGYRMLRKADLTIAILESRGSVADEIRPAVEAKAAELAALRAERERIAAELAEAEEAEREEAARLRRETSGAARGERGGSRNRGGRGRGGSGGGSGERGRGRGGERRPGDRPDRKPRERGEQGGKAGQSAPAQSTSGQASSRGSSQRGGRGRGRGGDDSKQQGTQTQQTRTQQTQAQQTVTVTGVFEPGSGGGGRLRTNLAKRVRPDADVQRGEVRKWRLHRGDVVTGEARKTKRGRTDFQLAGITSVNGQDLAQREKNRVRFAEADAGGTGDRLAQKLFKHAPIGGGSRAVVTGPTRAAASEMIAKLADDLAGSGVVTALLVPVARPDGSAPTASGYDVVANEPGKPAEDISPALELVLERGKRIAESGRNAAVLIDGLDLLPGDKAAEVFNAARNLTQHGSLTVIGSAGAGSALEALATTIAVVSGGRRLKLDKKASWSADK
ncbi:MAG: Rho termination factor N-terminal domain-containing protein [Solirubrobacterales bacterium]